MGILSYTKGLNVKLQGKWQDISRVYTNITAVKESLKDTQKNVDDIHALWYNQACTLAEGNDIEPHMPTIARHQIH